MGHRREEGPQMLKIITIAMAVITIGIITYGQKSFSEKIEANLQRAIRETEKVEMQEASPDESAVLKMEEQKEIVVESKNNEPPAVNPQNEGQAGTMAEGTTKSKPIVDMTVKTPSPVEKKPQVVEQKENKTKPVVENTGTNTIQQVDIKPSNGTEESQTPIKPLPQEAQNSEAIETQMNAQAGNTTAEPASGSTNETTENVNP